MSSPCTNCRFRRPPLPSRDDARATVPAQTPQIAAQRARHQRETEIRQQQEVAAMNGTSTAPLDGIPQFHSWCLARSKVADGVFYFTDSHRGDCELVEPLSPQAHRDRAQATPPSPAPNTKSDSPASPNRRPHEVPLGFAVAVRRVEEGADERLENYEIALDPDAAPPAITGAGFLQSYLLFGGPGSGKTTFFKFLLERILHHDQAPGCLLLDPKASLLKWMAEQEHPTGLMVVCPGNGPGQQVAYEPTRFNLFGSVATIRPQELGTLLAEAVLAQAGDVSDGWQVLVNDLLQSATVLLSTETRLVTPKELLDQLLSTERVTMDRTGKPARRPRIEVTAKLVSRDGTAATAHKEAAERILEFVKTEEKNKLFVRQLLSNALGGLRTEEWSALSDRDGTDFYGDILDKGTRAVVSVGFGSPAFQRTLTTIIKAVFQHRALADMQNRRGRDDFAVLACDEYAEILTEGSSGLVSDARFFSQCREARIMCLLALQSTATARSRFPAAVRDRWDGIMGNINGRIFLRLNDTDTARAASDLVGKRQVLVRKTVLGRTSDSASATDTYFTYERAEVPDWVLTSRLPTFHGLAQGSFDGMTPVAAFVRCPDP
jgi:hypothetical protein